MEGDIMTDLKNSTLRDKYLNIYRFFLHIKEFPSDAYYQLRFWYQRADRGWANSDAWGFDWYLARVIKEGCQYLKKHKHGCPCLDGFPVEESGHFSDETFDLMCKEWDRRLDCIIYTFELAQCIQEDNFHYQRSTEWTQEKADEYNKIWIDWKYLPKPRALSLEECQRYEEGWNYFKDHFFSLWD